MIYELLLRFKPDGTYSGAHAIDFDANGNPALPRPINEADWPAIGAAVNAQLASALSTTEAGIAATKTASDAALAQANAQIASLQATLDTAKAAYLAKDNSTLDQLIADANKTAAQKQKDAIAAQIATLQAQAATL